MGPYKARDVAQYIVDARKLARDTLTPLQLMKITYLCHGWLLGMHGRPLVDGEFEAWQYGPVSRDLYDAIREYKSSPVVDVKGADRISLDETEKALVDRVIEFYSQFDGIRLSALTHERGSPWDQTWRLAGKNSPISNDLIENFYAKLSASTRESKRPEAEAA